jgi:ketosteroid isomerase-like protein
MPEESTTPDLVELSDRQIEAGNRGDLDAVLGSFALDAVLDGSRRGMPTFEGVSAIRSFFEDWWGAFEDLRLDREQFLDLGTGVVFGVIHSNARLAGGAGHVQQREGWVTVWDEGLIARATIYDDIDEARAVAERLAEERG